MASYLNNIGWAVVFIILLLSIFALAPPLFEWADLMHYLFLGLPLVDYFVVLVLLGFFFIVAWQHFFDTPELKDKKD